MKKRLAYLRLAAASLAVSLLLIGAIIQLQPHVQAAAGCQFLSAPAGTTPAFCDTFDAPHGTGNRSGDLNGTVWGVSRITGNMGNHLADGWYPTTLNLCGTQASNVTPEHDVRICNGHVVEATNDGGQVTALAMYPKQPFDITGRTGTVVFDVSNDSEGTHAAWPEFWYTDTPAPAPFVKGTTLFSVPKNAVGVRFGGECNPGQGWINCGPNCPLNNPTPVVMVDSAVQVTNYTVGDSATGLGTPPTRTMDNCVAEASGPSQLNHFELRISTTQIAVYGTDPFPVGASTLPPLKHIATITLPSALPFTHGLIWLEDAHYNGNKMGDQGTHTFAWDNVGFDGPVLPQDRAFDVPDNTAPGGSVCCNGGPSQQLGWYMDPSQSQSLTTLPLDSTALANATGALLTFGSESSQAGYAIKISVNGHSFSDPYPYPDSRAYSENTQAIPIPKSDLVTGPNTVTFSTDSSFALNVFNVDLIAVGGGGSPGGGGTPTPTATATHTPNPTPAPTPITINHLPCTVQLPSGTQTGTCTGTFTPGG